MEPDCATFDNACGVCNGDGSTCLPETVQILLSSTEPVAGLQFQLTGGGTYSQYVAQTNQFNQFIDIAPQFYNSDNSYFWWFCNWV